MEKRVLVVNDGKFAEIMVQQLKAAMENIPVVVLERRDGLPVVVDARVADVFEKQMRVKAHLMLEELARELVPEKDHRQHLNKPAGKKLQYYHNRRRY